MLELVISVSPIRWTLHPPKSTSHLLITVILICSMALSTCVYITVWLQYSSLDIQYMCSMAITVYICNMLWYTTVQYGISILHIFGCSTARVHSTVQVECSTSIHYSTVRVCSAVCHVPMVYPHGYTWICKSHCTSLSLHVSPAICVTYDQYIYMYIYIYIYI